MTYKEESYVLDTLKEIQETIRSPEFKQLIWNGTAWVDATGNEINTETT